MTEREQIIWLRTALKSLSESAVRYIDDGSWIEHVTLDLQLAKEVLDKTRLNIEEQT
jgi:hypothetical protein